MDALAIVRMLLEHERYLGLGMDASSDRMLFKHSRYCGLGMGALVIACTRTWTLFWFGHGCTGNWMNFNMNVILVWVVVGCTRARDMDAASNGCNPIELCALLDGKRPRWLILVLVLILALVQLLVLLLLLLLHYSY